MTEQLTTWVDETHDAASRFDHIWDWRAIDWPLTKESVVVEVGGYKGRWALQIAERYHPRLFVFEPQSWAYEVCKAVLGDRARILDYGLGTQNGWFPMGEWETDGCSFVKPGDQKVWMTEIKLAFDAQEIDHVDLMLVNIEGYEYTLLPHMFDQGIYPDRLMVQFHKFADPDDHGARAIQQRMTGRYRLAWDYQVLTAWERL